MKISLRNEYLSLPRFNRYLVAASGDDVRADELYAANIRLAQSFHPLLSQFEVVVRNSLNGVLSRHFGDPDWILNQKSGFMIDPTLKASKFFLRRSVEAAEKKLTGRSVPITSGKIISDQNFGFWVSLFLKHHYSLIGGQPIHAFLNKPAAENRSSIYHALDVIREFRNRVNHCEPLCFNGLAIDCTHALTVRTKIYNLLEWIDPGLVPFFSSLDTVKKMQVLFWPSEPNLTPF